MTARGSTQRGASRADVRAPARKGPEPGFFHEGSWAHEVRTRFAGRRVSSGQVQRALDLSAAQAALVLFTLMRRGLAERVRRGVYEVMP